MIDLERWPALVLTAGLATRLRPLSLVRAKAAMPVAGEMLVRRILRWLYSSGVRRVVLNLHHLPDTITRGVGDGRDLGLEVRYSWEHVLLGSAGGPRHALSILEADQFFIVNGDTLTDVDVATLAAEHLRGKSLVTMAVVDGDVDRYGGVCAASDGDVLRFASAGPQARSANGPLLSHEGGGGPSVRARASASAAQSQQPPERILHFIGVQAVDARAFATVPEDRASETVRELYPRLIAEQAGSVRAWPSLARFLDIGTGRDYLSTAASVARQEGRGLDVGTGARVHPSARVHGSLLWDNVSVGAGAEIVDCVVADHVVVPEGARHERQALVQIGGMLRATDL